MKVCSFLPAATRMIYDMGLQDLLYGVTFECPEEVLAEKPKIVRCIMEGKNYSSKEIDRVFSAAKPVLCGGGVVAGNRTRHHLHPGYL
jgi:iron complex transport system substrate-binding protein